MFCKRVDKLSLVLSPDVLITIFRKHAMNEVSNEIIYEHRLAWKILSIIRSIKHEFKNNPNYNNYYISKLSKKKNWTRLQNLTLSDTHTSSIEKQVAQIPTKPTRF